MGSLGSVASTVVLGSLATGFLYLLLTGIQWARRIKASIDGRTKRDWRRPDWCTRCGRKDTPREDCSSCLKPVCHSCSLLTPSRRLCTPCIKTSDKELSSKLWIFRDLRERFKSTVANIQRSQRKDEDVRDVIEKLTEKLVGGSLDNVRISQLSSHPAYMGFMERYQGVLSLTLTRLSSAFQFSIESPSKERNDSGKHVHLQLKDLIREIIHEANGLPIFKGHKKKSRNSTEDLSTKTYEDILATAILNKVVEKFQFHLKKPNGQPMDFPIGDESDDNSYPYIVEEPVGQDEWMSTSTASLTEPKEDSTGTSSNDESYDDCSEDGEFVYHDKFAADLTELREDSSFMTSSDGLTTTSWEGNWLFKKKKLKNKPQSPVAMLVPSPNEDVKAQIGGTDADETSDLSDYSESELVQLLNSNYKDNFETPKMKETCCSDVKAKNEERRQSFYEQLLFTSLEDTESSKPKDLNYFSSMNITETRNPELTDYKPYTGEESLGIEQDSEYTESYEIMEQMESTNIRLDADVYCENKEMEGDQLERNHITENQNPDLSESSTSLEDGNFILPSVRQLAKHFAGKHNYHKVHSLTARNLARGLQDNNSQKALEPLEKEVRNERKVKPQTRIRSNIAFWEELARTNK